jgi:hypothetical protein
MKFVQSHPDVLEEHIASIFKVEEKAEQDTSVKAELFLFISKTFAAQL